MENNPRKRANNAKGDALVPTNRKCSDCRRGIWNLRSNQRMFIRMRYQVWHICHGTTSVIVRVHVRGKSFFFPPWAYIFLARIRRNIFFLLIISWGKLYSFKLPLPHTLPPPPRSHHFKRRLGTNLLLHYRGSDYKHDVAFIKWN